MRRWAVVLLLLSGLAASGCALLTPELGMSANIAKGKFPQVLERFEEIGGYEGVRERPAGWQILWNACEAHFQLNDYERADTCYSRLARLIPDNLPGTLGRPNYHDLVGTIAAHRALMQIDVGDYEAAIRLADEALLALEQGATQQRKSVKHIQLPVFAMQVAGLAHAFAGHRDRAEHFAHRIDEWEFEKDFGTKIMGLPFPAVKAQFEIHRNARAAIYFALHDYEEVRRIIETERPIPLGESFDRFMNAVSTVGLSEALAPSLESMLSSWEAFKAIPQSYMYARALYECGAVDEARSIYDQLLRPGALQNFAGLYYAALADRARIARADGDNALAIEHLETAIVEVERQRSTINSEAGKIGFAGDKQAIYADLVDVLIAEERFDDAFVYAERAKSRALVDLLASKQSFGADKSERRKLSQRVLAEIDAVDRSALRGSSRSDFDAARTRGLAMSRQEPSPVALKTRVIDAQLASVVTVAAPDGATLRGLLAPSETLLEYFGHGKQLFVFVVERNHTRAVALETEGLDAAIARFRVSLESPSERGYVKEGRWLYRRLIAPVAHWIRGTRLTIVPHGKLHYLPFAALDDGRGPLLNRYAIRLLPSLSVAEFLFGSSLAAQPIMVMGNPDKGDPNLDLPYAGIEAANIARTIQGSTLLLRAEATETALKQTGHRYRWLHFASHGEFNSRAPLASRLLLAPDSRNDGDLTLSEVFDIEIDADLVTLSACETALGEVASGDDVVGFTRGFLFAGARSVVASLWKVDDRATSALMESFYHKMRSLDRRDALRQAQLELRTAGRDHPFYWAAFQLTGATGRDGALPSRTRQRN